MKTIEVLRNENSNTSCIFLYSNGGIFYRAYDRSAYAFCTRIKPLKAIPKELKSERMNYVMIGFPVNQLESYLSGFTNYSIVVDGNPVQIMLLDPIDESAYQDWRRSFFPNSGQDAGEGSPSTVEPNAIPAESGDVVMLHQAARDILNLDMSSLTPIDSFMFLHDLRKRLKDYNAAIQ